MSVFSGSSVIASEFHECKSADVSLPFAAPKATFIRKYQYYTNSKNSRMRSRCKNVSMEQTKNCPLSELKRQMNEHKTYLNTFDIMCIANSI